MLFMTLRLELKLRQNKCQCNRNKYSFFFQFEDVKQKLYIEIVFYYKFFGKYWNINKFGQQTYG